MIKNIATEYEVGRYRREQEQKPTTKKPKYKNPLKVNKELPADYNPEWTVADKIKYLRRKLPPWKKPDNQKLADNDVKS